MTQGICSVEGCERPARCRGWCTKHYQRWAAHGDPLHEPYSALVRSQFDRAMVRVDKNGPISEACPDLGPCWLWTGPVHPDGYVQVEGRRNVGLGPKLLHRLIYEELIGPIPCYPQGHPEAGDPMPLDHLCHTVDLECVGGSGCLHRRCCNPVHLEPVTREKNHERAHFPNAYRTACKHGHPYTPENTYRAPSSPNTRQCRACAREAQRRYAVARKAS